MKEVYVRNIYNKNYIKKIPLSHYNANADLYRDFILLNPEETKAEETYQKYLADNRYRWAAKSAAEGATAGLSALIFDRNLPEEEREAFARYKGRSTISQAAHLTGLIGSVVVGGGVGRAALGTAAGRLGAGAWGVKAAQLTGEAAGVSAYTGTERVADLVGDGREIDSGQYVDIYTGEFGKNLLIGGAFSGAWAGAKAGVRGVKNVSAKAVEKGKQALSIRPQTPYALDIDYAVRSFGADASKSYKTAAGAAKVLGKTSDDARTNVKNALGEEAADIIGETANRVGPRNVKLTDLEDALETRLASTGKRIEDALSDISLEGLDAGARTSIINLISNAENAILKRLRVMGPGDRELAKALKAARNNLVKLRRVTEKRFKLDPRTKVLKPVKKTVVIRELYEDTLERMATTRQLIGDLIDKATGTTRTQGVLNQLYGEFSELINKTIRISAGKEAAANFRRLNSRYTILTELRKSLGKTIKSAKDQAVTQRVLRDSARGVTWTGGRVVGGAIGAGAGAIGGGMLGLVGGSIIGAFLGDIAERAVKSPWRMTIYPDVATQASRFLSGGQMVPAYLGGNITRRATERGTFFRGMTTLGRGIRSSKKPFKHNFTYLINQMTAEEEREVYVNIHSVAKDVMTDPQKLNQFSMGVGGFLAQMGAGQYEYQAQMNAVNYMKKVLEAFPEDRVIERADDVMGSENLWSKHDLSLIRGRLNAIFEPDDVVDDLLKGDLDVTLDQIQYLNYVYPYFFAALKRNIIAALNNGQLTLSRKEKNRLSFLLSIPLNTAAHPSLMSITEQSGGLAMERQAQQKEQLRKNLNLERKSESIKTGAERSLLNENRV